MKSKSTAGILALFLGSFGFHKFYLGRSGVGFLYLIFFWTFIPAIIAFVDAIVLFTMDETVFAQKYNPQFVMAASPTPQPIVVSVNQSVGKASISAELRDLASLRDSGTLTEAEFQEQKLRLLGG